MDSLDLVDITINYAKRIDEMLRELDNEPNAPRQLNLAIVALETTLIDVIIKKVTISSKDNGVANHRRLILNNLETYLNMHALNFRAKAVQVFNKRWPPN